MFVNRYGQLWKELGVVDVFMDRIKRCHVCECIQKLIERLYSRRLLRGQSTEMSCLRIDIEYRDVTFVNRYGQIWKELMVEDVFMDRIQRCHVCE